MSTLTPAPDSEAERLADALERLHDSKKLVPTVGGQQIGSEAWNLRTSGYEFACMIEAANYLRAHLSRQPAAQNDGPIQRLAILESRILAATVAACSCDTKTDHPDAHDAKCTYRVLMGLLDAVQPAAHKGPVAWRYRSIGRVGGIPPWVFSADPVSGDVLEVEPLYAEQPAARKPEGQWVPKEPTDNMLDAGACAFMEDGSDEVSRNYADAIYKAMLRASEPTAGESK